MEGGGRRWGVGRLAAGGGGAAPGKSAALSRVRHSVHRSGLQRRAGGRQERDNSHSPQHLPRPTPTHKCAALAPREPTGIACRFLGEQPAGRTLILLFSYSLALVHSYTVGWANGQQVVLAVAVDEVDAEGLPLLASHEACRGVLGVGGCWVAARALLASVHR